MRAQIWITGAVVWCLVSAVTAQIPPGYKVVHVSDGPEYDRNPAINNRGQIVFSRRFDVNNSDTEEIFLYENGQLTRLTNDNTRDAFPDISDDGTIVWSRSFGPDKKLQIMRYQNGQFTQITNDDSVSNSGPKINNLGHIVWYNKNGQGCQSSGAEIFFYDGTSIQQVSNNGYSNQTVWLNDFDEIVWIRFDFCFNPWRSVVMYYANGVTTPLTTYQFEPGFVTINNEGQVVWFWRAPPDYHHTVQTWENGATTTLTEWGSSTYLNNIGQMSINRWHEDSETWQVWLYRDGQFWQITDGLYWNYDASINDRGELAWAEKAYPEGDIRYLKRLPIGDLNCDDTVDFFDIDPFVRALVDPPGYEAQYPGCDWYLADMNGDGTVDFFDIDTFIGLLL